MLGKKVSCVNNIVVLVHIDGWYPPSKGDVCAYVDPHLYGDLVLVLVQVVEVHLVSLGRSLEGGETDEQSCYFPPAHNVAPGTDFTVRAHLRALSRHSW